MWNGNLKTALSSLRSNKWRSFLTMMGIIIGVSSVITIVSLGEGLKQEVVGQISRLGSDVVTVRSGKLVSQNGQASTLNLLGFLNASTLTNADVAAIAKLPSVEHVTPINFVTNSAKTDSAELNDIYVVGSSPNLPDIVHPKINYGDFFSSQDTGDNVAIIGHRIAEQLFGRLNPIGNTVNISGTDFIVRGVFAPSPGGLFSIAQTDFDSAIFIPMPAAESLSSGHTNILQILAKSKSNNSTQAVADIKKSLLKTHGGTDNFTVLKQEELLGIAKGVVNTIATFISGIAAISLLVGGIGIMDIMLVSVSERTKEIGIRKALGATNRQILNQFLTEGVALSVGGGLIGVIVAGLIYGFLKIYTHLQPVITPWIVVLAVGVSVGIGIIFSVAPALKAARKNPIDALRGE
jgi:putative ABC transport system permease protein